MKGEFYDRRGAIRRKPSSESSHSESSRNESSRNDGSDLPTTVEEEEIVPIKVNIENVRKERMKSVKLPSFLTTNTLCPEPLDRRTASIKRAQQGMRPEEKKALIKDDFAYIFFKIAGEDELLDAFELQHFMHLIYKNKYPKASDFNLETCRAMIASLDDTMRGKITFTQFKTLWMRLMKWAHAYNTSDLDNDGNMNKTEFSIALKKMDFHFSEEHVGYLMNKFQTREEVIQLDDFIQICCKARSAKYTFRNACEGRIEDGSATLSEFLMEVLKT